MSKAQSITPSSIGIALMLAGLGCSPALTNTADDGRPNVKCHL